MGRTLATYNMLVLQELEKDEWKRFRRALRRDDQELFMVPWRKTGPGCLKEGVPWIIPKYEASSTTDPTQR